MDDKFHNDMNRQLLDDAEFAKLIEQEAAGTSDRDHEPAEARVWERLQSNLGQQPQAQTKSRYVPYYWAAAAILLLGVGTKLFYQPDQQDQFKSGGVSPSGTGTSQLQVAPLNDGSLQITLSSAGRQGPAFALLADQAPPLVLWQGLEEHWPGSITVPGHGTSRICVVEADTLEKLNKKLSLIVEFKELPGDAHCSQ